MRCYVAAGDVRRTQWDPALDADPRFVPLYLGSGRFGGCFDSLGMMGRPFSRWDRKGARANTVLMHAEHWTEGRYGLHYHLPLAHLRWQRPASASGPYEQHLSLYDGCLMTSYTLDGAPVHIRQAFHPGSRDVLAVEVQCSRGQALPSLQLQMVTQCELQYDNHLQGSFVPWPAPGGADVVFGRLRVGTAHTVVGVTAQTLEGSVDVEEQRDGFAVHFGSGPVHVRLLIGAAGYGRRVELTTKLAYWRRRKDCLTAFSHGWHRRYGDAWIELPDAAAQAMWARSLYYCLSSYAPDSDNVAPPHGWTGNGWCFHFPQDFSYILPALLRLGHVDIAKAKVEYYAKTLPAARAHTRRIYGSAGVVWPWEHPIGARYRILDGESPNWFQYELHNAAYPVRMAWETAQHLGSFAWLQQTAWPLIREGARFFASALTQEPAGDYSLHVQPSMGQDEFGGPNAKNYLCALFAAEYCLRTATEAAELLGQRNEETDRWKHIIRRGLAYSRLFDPHSGIWKACESEQPAANQKHPVQLNPLVFLPLEGRGQAREVSRAYNDRYALCGLDQRSGVPGWTLGAYWLAAAHRGDGEGLLADLEEALPRDYVDSEGLQFYESSSAYAQLYYTTTHGLWLQAVQDALVSDFWSSTEVGAAVPKAWSGVRFHGLQTKSGACVSGSVS